MEQSTMTWAIFTKEINVFKQKNVDLHTQEHDLYKIDTLHNDKLFV